MFPHHKKPKDKCYAPTTGSHAKGDGLFKEVWTQNSIWILFLALWFQRHPLQRNGETVHWNSLVPELWWNSCLSEQLHRGLEGLLHLFCGKDTDKGTVSDQNTRSQVFQKHGLSEKRNFFQLWKNLPLQSSCSSNLLVVLITVIVVAIHKNSNF